MAVLSKELSTPTNWFMLLLSAAVYCCVYLQWALQLEVTQTRGATGWVCLGFLFKFCSTGKAVAGLEFPVGRTPNCSQLCCCVTRLATVHLNECGSFPWCCCCCAGDCADLM